jgi:hypothetical protein
MAFDPQEPTAFQLVATPVVEERSCLVFVPQKKLLNSTSIARGTTLATFCGANQLANIGEGITHGYGDYTLTEPADAPSGYLGFYFCKPKTAEQAGTAIRSYYDVEPSYYWPPVLQQIDTLQKPDGTYSLKPTFKESYDGPTRILVQEFFSPDPFTISAPTVMRPLSFDGVLRANLLPYDLNIGSLQLPRCLRGNYTISVALDPPVTIGSITWLNAVMSIPATNFTDWPASLVIDDRQRQVSGGWLRRTVTAYPPT